MSDFIAMRQNMVKGQVLPENIISPALLNAFLQIPREKFVPYRLSRVAYMDLNFPLTQGRYLLRPATLARLLNVLAPEPFDRILYIAAGTGYGPALLSQMGAHVIALDSNEAFTQETERCLQDIGVASVEVVLGSFLEGWEKGAPYDKMLIEGCIKKIPPSLGSQLKEGGFVVTLREGKPQKQEIVKYINHQGSLMEFPLFDAFAPRLSAFYNKELFLFDEED